jgi:hypothetical protein
MNRPTLIVKAWHLFRQSPRGRDTPLKLTPPSRGACRLTLQLDSEIPPVYFRFHAPRLPARQTTMLMQPNSSYRYYRYYGSLSARRDGTAKDCRRVLVM